MQQSWSNVAAISRQICSKCAAKLQQMSSKVAATVRQIFSKDVVTDTWNLIFATIYRDLDVSLAKTQTWCFAASLTRICHTIFLNVKFTMNLPHQHYRNVYATSLPQSFVQIWNLSQHTYAITMTFLHIYLPQIYLLQLHVIIKIWTQDLDFIQSSGLTN